jgi:Oxidoreductase family, NAD-binding Rossmann fold
LAERIGIVGLGRISKYHLEALEAIGDGEVVGGVDVDPGRSLIYRQAARPVLRSVEQLAALNPTTVIVATPTASHFETCRDVLSTSRPPRRLFVEKPIAASLAEVEELLAGPPDRTEISAIYHAAHAPEVIWASERAGEWAAAHGPIVEYQASFADPYRDLDREIRNRVYVTSWFDSGINALSVALRFIELREVSHLDRINLDPGVYRARVVYASGGRVCEGTIQTSWDVDAPAKSTAMAFESGACLRLDHQRIRGTLEHDGQVIDSFAYQGHTARLILHYVNAFTSLLVDRSGYCTREQSRLLHRLLFQFVA